MPTPLVSVILVCRNPGSRLRDALASIWAQQNAACEVVVIDGDSIDGTREWLETQRPQLGALLSEPDRGVYDAMNKGLARARGDWILFLGADDRLVEPGVLAGAASLLENTKAEVAIGEAGYTDGRIYGFADPRAAIRRNFVHHQAAFYRRTLFARHGCFDAALLYQADYDFNLRLVRAGVSFASLSLRIAACGPGGMSDSGRWANYHEEISVRHRYFPAWQCWLWDLGSVMRFLRKSIVRLPQPHG